MTLSLLNILSLGLIGLGAGWLGALVGIGGGIVVVPTLVLIYGVDIKIAVATSLIAVVATSTAAGSIYVGKGQANMRLGMVLEIATTLGGITGGLVAIYISQNVLSALFAVLVVVTATLMFIRRDPDVAKAAVASDAVTELPPPREIEGGHEEQGRLAGSFYDGHLKQMVHYDVERLPFGLGVSFGAGLLSGMLGVGGGFLKVPAMNLGMRVPIKVAAATSNFMIGVTAASSLFVYFAKGLVHPALTAPLVIGIVGGAVSGARFARKASASLLRRTFAVVLILIAVQMALKAMGIEVGK